MGRLVWIRFGAIAAGLMDSAEELMTTAVLALRPNLVIVVGSSLSPRMGLVATQSPVSAPSLVGAVALTDAMAIQLCSVERAATPQGGVCGVGIGQVR